MTCSNTVNHFPHGGAHLPYTAPMRVLVLMVALSSGFAWSQALPRTLSQLGGDPGLENALHNATNRARTEAGRGELGFDPLLTQAARHHAAEMARLEFFAHTSPTPERATLRHRVAAAGSALVTLAENLALVPDEGSVATTVVEGWLASPGHRTNLLEPLYTHVGYGSYRSAGQVYVVQVLGYRPYRLVAAASDALMTRYHEVALEFAASRSVSAALAVGAEVLEPIVIPAGRSQQRLATGVPGRFHLRAGIALADGAGYVVDESGWIDTRRGGWDPDPTAARTVLEVLSVSVEAATATAIEVVLGFAEPLEGNVVVFADGRHLAAVVTTSTAVSFSLPVEATRLELGETIAGSRVRVTHALQLEVSPFARIVPARP